MTTNEQLKALAEAAHGWEWLCDDPDCGCREAMEAYQKEATPERILALIAENEWLTQANEYLRATLHEFIVDGYDREVAIKALGETK